MGQEKNFHEIFLGHIPFLMWAKDMDGNFIAVNSSFAQLFSRSTEELIGLNDFDICPKNIADKYRADDLRVMTTGCQLNIEEMIPLEQGFRWHETIKLPLKDEDGKVYGV